MNFFRPVACFVFLLLIMHTQLSAGSVDSLEAVLKKEIHDTVRVYTLIELAEQYYENSPEKAILACEQARDISEKTGFETGLINSYGWLAYLYEQTGQIDKAIDYNNRSLALAEKTDSKKDQAVVLNNLAAIYKDLGRIDEALQMHHRSLRIRIAMDDKSGISTSYNNIGLICAGQGRIAQALDYYSKALKIEEELKNDEGISTLLLNIGSVYRDQGDHDKAFEYFDRSRKLNEQSGDNYSLAYSLNGLGNLFEEQGKPDSALYYYRSSLAIRLGLADVQGVSYSHKNIGVIFSKTNQPDSARWYFEKSLKGFDSIGDKWGMAVANNKLGKLFLDLGKTREAKVLLDRALVLSKELGYPADIRDAAGNLQQLFRKEQQWKDALQMNDLYIAMRDSVINDKNRKAILRTQFSYEYHQKELALKAEQDKKDAIAHAEIRKQRILRNSIAAGLAGLFIFSVILFRQRNKISKARRVSDELLLNILPSETAEELKSTGFAKAKDFREVTVLFTDFKNFTLMSERLSAQELVNEINHCYCAFDNIIGKYGVEKIKTIGDSYMCAAGLPVVSVTHAADAINAALDIRDFIAKEVESRKAKGEPFFEIRIGLHTGPVVAGIVGIKKFAYDIWGDTVNIASRMESSGETGKVNISDATHRLVKHQFHCTHRGQVGAKNKGAIDMYFVERS
jgi:adenylate cyclase